MKIISWNLRNLGATKLANPFTVAVAGRGLGNNVLDYVLNVVMGRPVWAPISSGNPADIFVIIELKSGGHNKGQNANGTAIPTLATIVAAMNTMANNLGVGAQYQYLAAVPLITGRHETVGVIFNQRVLTWNASAVRRDVNNQYINPRTPFSATLTVNATGAQVVVTGVHAPPPSGGAAVRNRPPVNSARAVATVPQLATANQLVMGDYNCTPASTYTNGFGVVVGWNWPGYGTLIPNGTLSSVRLRVAGTQPPPQNYLSAAYDNLLYNFNAGGGAVERVLDTIANARDMTQMPPAPMYPASLVALLNNYNKVSDHLPLYMEF